MQKSRKSQEQFLRKAAYQLTTNQIAVYEINLIGPVPREDQGPKILKTRQVYNGPRVAKLITAIRK